MKIFQRLLVAPAALGLLTPLASNASDVNLNDISNYSNVENIEFANTFNDSFESSPLIAGGEGMVHDHDSDSFSSTTTASFSADMYIGAVNGNGVTTTVTDGDEAIEAYYGFQIDLNTSFTGEDSLDISLDAGNGSGSLTEVGNGIVSGDGTEALTVDGVTYTFPVGEKVTAFVGDNTDGSLLYSTACVYGVPGDTLDDCGAASAALGSGAGSAIGASYDIGNGFAAAVGYTGNGGNAGLLTAEGDDAFGVQLSYAADSYGASVSYANIETVGVDTTYWALNGYYTPSEVGGLPSISVGFESGDPETAGAEDTSQYFVGLQWDEMGPGTLGVAMGTDGAFADNVDEFFVYEAFYSYPVNDGMTITPYIYLREQNAVNTDDTGIAVVTSFSF